METIEAIRKRRSVNFFDNTRKVTERDVEQLVELATQAPSGFNLQNWRFIAVTDDDRKRSLRSAAFDQAKVEDAAVTFVVLGDLEGYKETTRIMDLSVKDGIVDKGVRDYFVDATPKFYRDSLQMARDEAIRSGSLAAMVMMLAAESLGMVSCPMIGFDAGRVAEMFHIPARFIPVMLLPIGYEGKGNWARKTRRPIAEIFTTNTF